MIRKLCRSALAASGYRTLTAENGQRALGLFQSSGNEIDLIVSDLIMPIMGGVEFVRSVFQSDPHANVILMTGYGPDEVPPGDLERICKLLKKPFRVTELVSAVSSCLEGRASGHAILVPQ